MHCEWCVNSYLELCGLPATKNVVVLYEGKPGKGWPFAVRTIWLCDAHYQDPYTQQCWQAAGFTWEY